MKTRSTLLYKIKLRIKKRKDSTFVLNDFCDFIKEYDYDQVLRALRILTTEKILVKIGRGIYAKTKILSNGAVILSKSLSDLAIEALKKLGITTSKSKLWLDYNSGKTTQVPNGRVIAVNKRVRRKISYNGYEIEFESI